MAPTHSTVPSMLSMVLPLRRDLLKVGGADVHLAVEGHETVQWTGHQKQHDSKMFNVSNICSHNVLSTSINQC